MTTTAPVTSGSNGRNEPHASTIQWATLFQERRQLLDEARAAAEGTHMSPSVTIDWFDAHRFDPDLADALLADPDAHLAAGEDVLRELAPAARLHGQPRHVAVRVRNLPEVQRFGVRDARQHHVEQLIAVRAIVQRTSQVLPLVTDAVFECQRCTCLVREPQVDAEELQKPVECYEEQGGCGRQGKMRLAVAAVRGHSSKRVDWQRLDLQEPPDELPDATQPQRLTCYVRGDLAGRIPAGARVVANGILRAMPHRAGQRLLPVLDYHLDVVSVDMLDADSEDEDVTPEDVQRIREIATGDDPIDRLRQSFAPSLRGFHYEKIGMLLAMFGSIEGRTPDGRRVRGDIHSLLVGDPGKAKSALLRFAKRLVPRAYLTNGKGTSGAGLTAAAVKDDGVGAGRWTLEAGPAVFAHRGLLLVDELDKMNEADVPHLLECMEDGTVTVTKAGIHATLNAAFRMIAAANPRKGGRFEVFEDIGSQIGLPPHLLSRFDLIFPIQDIVNATEDAQVAETMLDGYMVMTRDAAGDGAPTATADENALLDAARARVTPHIEPAIVRKWIAYARQHVHPVLPTSVRDKLRDMYVSVRDTAKSSSSGAIPITARQLDALARLSIAAARLRLSPVVEARDADVAIRVFRESTMRAATNERGELDSDRLGGAQSAQTRNLRDMLLDAAQRLADEAGAGNEPTRRDLLREFGGLGLNEKDAQAALTRLLRDDDLTFRGRGYVPTRRRRREDGTQ